MATTVQDLDFLGRPCADHVPRELIRHIDFFNGPGMDRDPFTLARSLRDEPPMLYNLRNPLKGQSWLPTRAEQIRAILADPVTFSSAEQAGFAEIIGENWRLGPVEMDPPDHGKFRRLMNPWLSPAVVSGLGDRVRQRAIELIDSFLDDKSCEFVSQFGTPFPISIFMEMMGLPHSLTAVFLGWVDKVLHSDDLAVKAEGALAIADYLRELIAERRAHPIDDLASRIASSRVDGETISDDDMLGLAYLLFTGGLDTVASSLAFHLHFLATNPELQDRLRRHPEDIPAATEELLRAFSPVVSQRRAMADVDIAGVAIAKGDWITLIHSIASLDPHEFDSPDRVDLDRRNNRHFAFAFGPHFCAGSHLARREIHVALEEWTSRVPPFRLADGAAMESHGGIVFGANRLELCWE